MRPCSLLLALLAGCTAGTDDLSSVPLPSPPIPAPDEALMLFAAEDPGADQLQLAAVAPNAGVVLRHGPPIPGVQASRHRIEELHVRSGEPYLVVEVAPIVEGASRFLFALDGDRWITLFEDPGARVGFTDNSPLVSPQMTRIWAQRGRNIDGRWEVQGQLLDRSGASVLTTPWALSEQAPRPFYFAPDDSWQLWFRDRAIDLESAIQSTRLEGQADGPWPRSRLLRAFPQSLILRPSNLWLDLTGQPLQVPGFEPEGRLWGGGFQVSQGTLFRLDDQRLTELQPLGAHDLELIIGHGPQGALTEDPLGDRVHLVGARGQTSATYEAPQNTLDPMLESPTVDVYLDVVAKRLLQERTTALITLHYEARNERSGVSFEESVDAWISDHKGARAHRVRTVRSYREVVIPRLSEDGRFAVWVEEGAPRRMDIELGRKTAMSTDLVLVPFALFEGQR